VTAVRAEEEPTFVTIIPWLDAVVARVNLPNGEVFEWPPKAARGGGGGGGGGDLEDAFLVVSGTMMRDLARGVYPAPYVRQERAAEDDRAGVYVNYRA
jgi:hypothetical protein